MATTNLDIILDNRANTEGPLSSINLYVIDHKSRSEVTQDGKTSSSSHKKPYEFKTYGRIIVMAIIIVITITIFGCIFANYMLSSSEKSILDEETKLRMVPRDEWNARPLLEALTMLNLPVHRVIIAHSATGDCTSQAECSSATQNIQTFHIDSKDFADLAYNFLVGGDGAVYEGRGWDNQGAHTKGFNEDSICIALIGTFDRMIPTEGQINATKLIIKEGVKLKKLVEDYRLYGTRQFMGSESPGQALYEIIQK